MDEQDNSSGLGTLGKYELKRQIGRGSSGTVYLATDSFTREDVALKVLDNRLLADHPVLSLLPAVAEETPRAPAAAVEATPLAAAPGGGALKGLAPTGCAGARAE
jgi:serine/threonine protein kinase